MTIWWTGCRRGCDHKLTVKFIVISVLLYFALLIWGGGLIAIPLFHKLLGGGIGEEFIFILYWGLILLVAYIGLCTCLLSEYFCSEEAPVHQGKPKEED